VHRFLQRHASRVMGVLAGFDRLVFRGTLMELAYARGLGRFLGRRGVLRKDFKPFAGEMTERVKEASRQRADQAGRPVIYLNSSKTSKEDVARKIARDDNVTEGLIAVLTSIESCMTYQVYRNRERKHLELRPHRGKCLHLYHYGFDPLFGFMSARIQTWFPFSFQICINGREWLGREMRRADIPHIQVDNCFPWIENVERAQKMMDGQLRVSWPEILSRVVREVNPEHGRMFGDPPFEYYWTAFQSEWATDVMFVNHASLTEIYRPLVSHAMTTFSSSDVMRFLGKKADGRFLGQVVSDFKNRAEGVRIKHRVRENSVKMYDKAGSILRCEVTINNPTRFKVFRPSRDDPRGPSSWRPMRKGTADLHRRTVICQKANERYLDALSAADTSERVGDLLLTISRPVRWKGRRSRALRPTDPQDLKLFRHLASGKNAVEGLRNTDVRQALFGPDPRDRHEKRKRAAAATRRIRLLRAHSLIRKLKGTHRYMVTTKGNRVSSAVTATQAATVEQLVAAA
jgi:hypothetical protein